MHLLLMQPMLEMKCLPQSWSQIIVNQFMFIVTILAMDYIDFSFLLLMLSEGHSARSLHHKSSLKLHHILQQFKQTEHYKSTLENKINVLHRQYESNKKKAKNIQSSIMRINEVKQQFRKEKDEISQLLSTQKENHHRKIIRDKERRDNSKENLSAIRSMVAQDKQEQYMQIKEKERYNEMRIFENQKKSLHQKRQKSLQVKLKQEQSKLAKAIFLQKKRLKAQRSSQKQVIPLQLGLTVNERYLTSMRSLQSEMVRKLDQSRETLTKSKLSLRKALH